MKVIEVKGERNFQITMSESEAEAVLAICRRAGGDMKGPRGYISELGELLEGQGVKVKSSRLTGTVSFPDMW